MSELNAAVTVPKSNHFKLAAATGVIQTKENPIDLGDYTNFDTVNRFFRYQQLIKSNPYSFIAMKKLKTSLTKGLDFDGKKSLVKEFQTWSKRTNLKNQAMTLAGYLFSAGTFAGRAVGSVDKLKLQPLVNGYMTILPEGYDTTAKSGELLQPEPQYFVVNEGATEMAAGVKEIRYSRDQIIYGTLDEWDSKQLDLKNRETIGLYGESLVEPLEVKIRHYLNIELCYSTFVQKYGMGRYSYTFPFLELMFEKGLLTWPQFQTEITEWMEKNKYLSQNEDLVGIVKATPVDAMGSLDIMQFKNSLENDIKLGFLQSDLSMGDSKGSTYAAGYVSEADRMVVLESLQTVNQNVLQDFIDKRLILLNKSPGSVEVIFDELSLPQMTASEVLEWATTGIIQNDEAREWGGFPKAREVNAE